MNGIFYIGATGLNAQQTAVDVIANNVANINTAAYKRGAVSFSELVAAQAPEQTRPDPCHRQRESRSIPRCMCSRRVNCAPPATRWIWPFAAKVSSNCSPIPAKSVLWRGGTLHVGEDGYLTAPNGLPLQAMISVPADATSLTVRSDGQVLAAVPGQSELLELGSIELVLANDTAACNRWAMACTPLPTTISPHPQRARRRQRRLDRPGLQRGIQRAALRRTGQPDDLSARLRGQCATGADRRRTDGHRQRIEALKPMTPLMLLLVLASADASASVTAGSGAHDHATSARTATACA